VAVSDCYQNKLDFESFDPFILPTDRKSIMDFYALLVIKKEVWLEMWLETKLKSLAII
jgi:hypothetical protein